MGLLVLFLFVWVLCGIVAYIGYVMDSYYEYWAEGEEPDAETVAEIKKTALKLSWFGPFSLILVWSKR